MPPMDRAKRPKVARPDSLPSSRGDQSLARDFRSENVEQLSPKRRSTKALLMDAGELLFAHRGFDGVTLREIAVLAGQANSNVVQYHFEDKSGLIKAILEDRVQRREQLRADRLADLKAKGEEISPRDLLAILWLPTLSFKDENAGHVFCRYLLQCRLHPDFSTKKPFKERFGRSVLIEIRELLGVIYKDVPKPVFDRRLSALSLMFFSSVVEFDNAQQPAHGAKFDAEPLLEMAVFALGAPQVAGRKKTNVDVRRYWSCDSLN